MSCQTTAPLAVLPREQSDEKWTEIRARLAAPFPANDVEWRMGQCGQNNNGVWAKALAYLTNRAIMERLDDVVGCGNWRNERPIAGPQGGVLCGLSIRNPHCPDEWVTKWDGAENTQIEAVKGGLSDAMKRAAVQWGIGRYLYKLEEGWCDCVTDRRKGYRYQGKKDGKHPAFYWLPPTLPDWALPAGEKPKRQEPAGKKYPASGLTPTESILAELGNIATLEELNAHFKANKQVIEMSPKSQDVIEAFAARRNEIEAADMDRRGR